MNIAGATGLTPAQVATLKVLGNEFSQPNLFLVGAYQERF